MKIKKNVLLLLLLFLFVLLSPSVSALESLVKDYNSLKEAISNVNVTEIKLANDIVITDDPGITIASNRNVVIDLNGKTLSMESSISSTSYLINNKGNLTIKDSTDIDKNGSTGKIVYSSTNPDMTSVPSYASNTITNSGKLIIESGKIENSTKRAPAAYVIDNNSSGGNAIVTINGGLINSTNNWGMRMFVNSNTLTNDVTLNDGFVHGGIWMQTLTSSPKANFIVNNGTIEGNNYAFYVYNPKVDTPNINIEINNGHFISTAENGYSLYIYDTNSNFTINDGIFDGTYALLYFTYNSSDSLTHFINGGKFNGYVEFDQKFKTDPDKNYTTNFTIDDGMFLNDVYVWGYNGNDWYLSTNTKFISGGMFADIVDDDQDCLWPELIVEPYTKTGKITNSPKGYPYTIGHKITLDSNYDETINKIIYTVKNSMIELEDISRDGYEFLGWNTKSDGTGQQINKDSEVNYETTLYAQWKIIPGNVKTYVETAKIKAKVEEDNVQNAVLSQEEKQSIKDGKNFKIDIIVNDISNDISKEEKAKIEENLMDKNVGMYIDISIIKTVEGEKSIEVTSTKNKLKFSINVPSELIRNDVNRQFYIVRMHDDEVEILDTDYDSINNTLTFETDKFSTYAIAYHDEEIDSNISNPKTFDKGVKSSIILLFLSVVGIIVFTIKLKKNKN